MQACSNGDRIHQNLTWAPSVLLAIWIIPLTRTLLMLSLNCFRYKKRSTRAGWLARQLLRMIPQRSTRILARHGCNVIGSSTFPGRWLSHHAASESAKPRVESMLSSPEQELPLQRLTDVQSTRACVICSGMIFLH